MTTATPAQKRIITLLAALFLTIAAGGAIYAHAQNEDGGTTNASVPHDSLMITTKPGADRAVNVFAGTLSMRMGVPFLSGNQDKNGWEEKIAESDKTNIILVTGDESADKAPTFVPGARQEALTERVAKMSTELKSMVTVGNRGTAKWGELRLRDSDVRTGEGEDPQSLLTWVDDDGQGFLRDADRARVTTHGEQPMVFVARGGQWRSLIPVWQTEGDDVLEQAHGLVSGVVGGQVAPWGRTGEWSWEAEIQH